MTLKSQLMLENLVIHRYVFAAVQTVTAINLTF